MSRRCLDSSCSTQSFLLARKAPLDQAGEPSPVWLGMSVGDVTDHLYASLQACWKSSSPGSSPMAWLAKRAGLQVGDMIASFSGIDVNDLITLVGLKSKIRVGDSVRLGVRRGSWELQLSMTAGVR